MNYIDALALKVYNTAYGNDPEDGEDITLYRIYALLALTVGEDVTAEHVHDAWSVWRAETKPDHKSLIPFAELTPDVQALDDKYVDAIRAVAAGMSK
jgi:hypothetical protein